MTVTRGLALFLTVAAAGALVKASGPAAGTPTVRLKTISARTSGSGASLVIEASEPVAYALTRPDALTVLVDFRNVTHDEVANTVAGAAKGAIAKVSVEQVESLGAPTARVRIALAQPVAHHARSDRNTVVIDFEKPSAKTPPYVTPKQTTTDARGTLDAMAALQQPQTPPQTPPQVAAVESAEIAAFIEHAARGRPHQLQDGVAGRRLAAARFADQPERAAARDAEAQAVDCLHGDALAGEVDREVLDLQQRAHGVRSARQVAQWPWAKVRRPGARSRQAATATLQRGRNGQSGIGSIRLGGNPSIGVSRRDRVPSTRGVEPSRPSV